MNKIVIIILLIILCIVLIGVYYSLNTTTDDVQQPELYYVSGGSTASPYTIPYTEAKNVASLFNGVLATSVQLQDAQTAGADWCAAGWLSDTVGAAWPTNTSLQTGCGNGTPQVMHWTPASNLAGVHVYGVKPTKTATLPSGYIVYPFNATKWSRYDK